MIHGISFTLDRELNVMDRILWLLVVVAFSGVAAALTWNLWSQWNDEQVVVVFVAVFFLDALVSLKPILFTESVSE